jgi:hypothetical protein
MAFTRANLVRLATKGVAPPNIVGVWQNELTSVMTIHAQDGSYFSGSYDSPDGKGGRVQGTIQGILSGETLGWTVSWQPAVDSTTTWTGKFLVDRLTNQVVIYTLWQMSSGDAALPVWESFAAGQDTFWQ